MFGIENSGSALDPIAHVIQVALTPVFLLGGIATLLNVFSTRLARVADRVEAVSKALDVADAAEAGALSAQLAQLHRRSVALDVAVILGAIGGAATCGAVLVLFVGALGEAAIASLLIGLFGLAVGCALGAICAFTAEMLMAGTGIRAEVAASRRTAARQEDAAEGGAPEGEAADPPQPTSLADPAS
ncbi:MAG TPA: DUF2721 domain-containing protein [Stellaceae bacterium]|nr:DUF2721 domain-containing protein [Stellaceae bacterium]